MAGAVAVVLAGLSATLPAQVALPTPAVRDSTAVQRFELEAAFSRADLDNDGKLSRAEAMRLPEIGPRFDTLDANHDGTLTLDEFANAPAAPAPG